MTDELREQVARQYLCPLPVQPPTCSECPTQQACGPLYEADAIIALVQGAQGEVLDEFTTDFATYNCTLYTFPVRVTVRAVPLPQPEDVAGILKGALGNQSSGDYVRDNWQEGGESA